MSLPRPSYLFPFLSSTSSLLFDRLFSESSFSSAPVLSLSELLLLKSSGWIIGVAVSLCCNELLLSAGAMRSSFFGTFSTESVLV